ncbi:MAG: hypothetical protein SH819_05470 [Cytophagales bacterium]|nr:hypothetical protein [Cytophagales bacterium]
MNSIGKISSVLVILVVLGVSCSKTATVTPTKGCNITFKGKPLNLPDVSCDEFQPGEFSVTATNAPGEQELTLLKNSSRQTINFVLSGDPSSFYSTTFSATPPTVTVSGLVWTFSGAVENGSGDSGSISGTCTCPN